MRAGFVDFVDVIGSRFENTLFSIAPGYRDGEVVGRVPGRKHTHRVVAREIATSANHFLTLRHRPAGYLDFCADPARVRGLTFQPYGDTRSRRVVAQNGCRPVQVVDDDVEVS